MSGERHDTLVELGLITLDDGNPGQGGHHVTVTDAGFLAVQQHLDEQDRTQGTTASPSQSTASPTPSS